MSLGWRQGVCRRPPPVIRSGKASPSGDRALTGRAFTAPASGGATRLAMRPAASRPLRPPPADLPRCKLGEGQAQMTEAAFAARGHPGSAPTCIPGDRLATAGREPERGACRRPGAPPLSSCQYGLLPTGCIRLAPSRLKPGRGTGQAALARVRFCSERRCHADDKPPLSPPGRPGAERRHLPDLAPTRATGGADLTGALPGRAPGPMPPRPACCNSHRRWAMPAMEAALLCQHAGRSV